MNKSAATTKRRRAVRRKRNDQPQKFFLDIGKYAALDLTLQRHGVTPNETTAQRIGGEL